ncbi:MAG TPA: T9SS type A sorting domain-containing protein [Chitinophagales bacterium]|nr:T9SS type A sorting domain-containing protein [Chitinophagales bacterium]
MKKIYLVLFPSVLMIHIVSAQNTWLQKDNFGGMARMGAAAFSIGTKGYIGTGGDFYGVYHADFWEYDPSTDIWTQKADFPGTSRYRALAFSSDSNGYIATGWDGTVGTSDLWEYDPASNSWTAKANMGGPGRLGAISFTIGSNVYAGTGYSLGFLSDFWEYNTVTNAWTQKADFAGQAKLYATGFSIGSIGYLGTGAETYSNGMGTNDFWEYDPGANSWTQKSNFPGTGRSEAVGFSIGSFGYIGTGTSNWGVGALADFWRYDPSTDTWITIASYPGGIVEEATAFVIGCKAYVGTGFINDINSTLKISFWEYTPDSGCYPLPHSNFMAVDTSICEKFCIDFTDQSINNPVSWQWYFAGGSPSSSTDQNPTNICYNTPGTFDVTLIITNDFGSDTLLLTDYITVYPTPPIPNILQNGNVLTCSPAMSYQWQLNSTDIPGATMQTYTYTQTGLYTVFAYDSNGCVSSADILITAVENPANDVSVFVSPNPSDGNFTVELINCSAHNTSLRILNTIGQEILLQNFTSLQNDYKKEINLRNTAAGVYVIEMKSGNEFIRKKIIVAE